MTQKMNQGWTPSQIHILDIFLGTNKVYPSPEKIKIFRGCINFQPNWNISTNTIIVKTNQTK